MIGHNSYAINNGWGCQNGAYFKGQASVNRLQNGGWVLWIGSEKIDTFATAELAMQYVDLS